MSILYAVTGVFILNLMQITTVSFAAGKLGNGDKLPRAISFIVLFMLSVLGFIEFMSYFVLFALILQAYGTMGNLLLAIMGPVYAGLSMLAIFLFAAKANVQVAENPELLVAVTKIIKLSTFGKRIIIIIAIFAFILTIVNIFRH